MPDDSIRPWNSLRWRFSILLVALIATAGMFQLFFSTRGWRNLVEHIEQQINWDLATDIAEKIQPAVKSSLDWKQVESLLLSLTISNPKAEFVFLGPRGEILAAIPYRDPVERKFINLEPLRRALEPQIPSLPLYADDPFNSQKKKIFSVSRLVLNNNPGYLYVPLMSSTYEFFIRNTGQFYLAKIIALGLLLSWLFALAAGFILFSFLSRRFRSIGGTIANFRSGDLSARVVAGNRDELDHLAQTFNAMADTISENTAELQRKDLLRRELIANISHDLRGPVTSTLAHLDALLGRPLPEQSREKYLRIIHENALAQNRLIEDLFDLSVLEANDGKIDRDYCSFTRIAESVLASLAPLAESKHLIMSTNLGENLPLIFADSRAIQRVLTNLISNAIRYTPENGTIMLFAEPTASGKKTLVRITDTGIGIPAEEIPYVFDSFYRANKNRPENPGGTGLGLAIVKRLLALHGTQPKIESVVDSGTTITFELATEPES